MRYYAVSGQHVIEDVVDLEAELRPRLKDRPQ